ncbi:MAG: cytochrome c biogenesis protein ResB [Pirellulales bacterium]|nr:cytochrome c biogenesis protein ResB [Pirellulales bacterium]
MASVSETQPPSPTILRTLGSWLRLLASLKLAVVLLILLGVVCAAATFVESGRGTEFVQWYCYDSPWFVGLWALLGLNLLAAMLVRFPWKLRQAGFLMTHAGVLGLMIGSVQTYWSGVEGQLSFAEGETTNMVTLGDRSQLTVLPPGSREDEKLDFSFNGGPVDWPEGRPLEFPETEGVTLRVLRFLRHARAETRWVADSSGRGPAAAKIAMIGPDGQRLAARWLPPEQFDFQAKAGDEIELDGGYKLSVLEYLPHARRETTYHSLEDASKRSEKAEAAVLVEVELGSTSEEVWLMRGDPQLGIQKIDTPRGPLWLNFGYQRLSLDYSLKLIDFERGTNPGRMGNASFSSQVELIDDSRKIRPKDVREPHTIIVNKPLTYGKFTFYQSNYQELSDGKEMSILSVAHDPGRLLKYAGSVLTCLGIFVVYYLRPRARRKQEAERLEKG